MANTDYQKINTLFMRDEKSIIIPEQFTLPEFEYLKDNKWECTEKIDGTNIHVDIVISLSDDGSTHNVSFTFHGRTSKAVIPSHLYKKLEEIFTAQSIMDVFGDNVDVKDELVISIYGEGYGVKIQKGGNYISDGVDFILFDVKVGNWWLNRAACENIASQFGIKIVPLMGYMTIPEAIEFVKKGFKSTVAENPDYDAEGLVLKTPNGLLLRNGERLITKIKTCDFQKYKAAYGEGAVEQKPNPYYSK